MWVDCSGCCAKALSHEENASWTASSLAAGVCRLGHDRMGQGPTGPHAGRSTFLLSSGGARGRVLLSGCYYGADRC